MEKQTTETGLSPVKIPEGETFVYCAGCNVEVSVVQKNGVEVAPLRDEEDRPFCTGCGTQHCGVH